MDDRLLSSVRDGAIELDDLLASARSLAMDSEGREALYDGIRGWMLTCVRSDAAVAEELAATKEAFHRISSLAWGTAPATDVDPLHVLAIRIETLADAIADHAGFCDNYNTETLRAQPHVETCLAYLHMANGSLPRALLLKKLGLKQANGTRVLKLLENARLIVRRRVAQAVNVELTQLGRKLAMSWRSPTAPVEPPPSSISLREGPVRGMANDQWTISAKAYASGR